MFLKDLKKFLKYFGRGHKLSLYSFVFLSAIAGIMEFVGIYLVYPFISIIINPSNAHNKFIYRHLQALTGIDDVITNALILGLIILLLFIFKNIYMILFSYLQSKIASKWRITLVSKFMEYFLFSNYRDNMKVLSADKNYIINTICPESVNICIIRTISLAVNVIIIVMIVSLIMCKYPLAGMSALLFVICGISIQNQKFKANIAKAKDEFNIQNKILNRITQTNIENLKEVKILSAEKSFFDKFCKQYNTTNNISIIISFYKSIPPHLLEIFVVSSLIILGTVVGIQNLHSQADMIASFTVLGIAIFRLAPALNRIQSSIINISAGKTYVQALLKYYEDLGIDKFVSVNSKEPENITLSEKIELKHISFGYNPQKFVLKDISFEIKHGEYVGIIGASGAGKTTLIDILTGLLPIDEGEIIVDNIPLNSGNFRAFRHTIGYVPQDIKTLETTLKENVAWGIPEEKINEDKVIEVLKQAQLYDIAEKSTQGINYSLKRKGLSAGQKQRLAIARALYRNPELILLDEATSALDVKTESEITDILNSMKGKKTIIAVAHRLSTLKSCDKIIYMKKGRIAAIGTFDEISKNRKDFKELIELSSITIEDKRKDIN